MRDYLAAKLAVERLSQAALIPLFLNQLIDFQNHLTCRMGPLQRNGSLVRRVAWVFG